MTSLPGPVLDERGHPCPAPVIALARAARDLPPGTTLAVLSDDPASASDVPAWCRLAGHEFLAAVTAGDAVRYEVRTCGP